ncbi:MAG: DUF1822 family protein [Aphanocapsa sp. GSE-SYN-MK-11-07L]|nr:DUF1822 family protein [Aphanocapsa sp. GSE-SYN-MK-11-07L]
MKLSLPELRTMFANQVWIELSATDYERAGLTKKSCTNETGCSNAELNQLCLNGFLDWASEHLDQTATPWPGAGASLWEMVNGTALTLGTTRLVLMPSQAMDTEELSVPQEWVDIPQWAADYYLGVQVNLEQSWMQIWGYTSHRTLKRKAQYDSIYRTYGLDRDFMITDLDLLWVAQELGLDEKMPLKPIAALTQSEAEALLVQLSQPTPYSPRLELEFEPWAGLLAQDEWRQRLYQQRLDNATRAAATPAAIAEVHPARSLQKSVINAALWLEDRVDRVAQELSWVLLPALALEPAALRSPTQELEIILAQLQRTEVDIPAAARSAYQNLELAGSHLRLYAVTWPIVAAETVPRWFLLLILAGQSGGTLAAGTKLLLSDRTGVLVERELSSDSPHQYIVGGVSGTWDETFRTTISLVNGASLTLPEFRFHPEPLV